ncbi:leukemia inhibitory factor receptor-like [Neosynchiropus ocellatus]
MLRGILLVVLLSTRATRGDGKDQDYFPCEPRDVKISTLDQRTLSMTWADDPSCIKFPEFKSMLVVFVGDLKAHSDEVVMTPKQNGSTHRWSWTSYLPLECVSHSVQLTYQYQNLTSRQKQAQTDPGLTSPHRAQVLPQDQIFLVGSRATFCCVIPESETFVTMYVSGNNDGMDMNTTQINNRTFMLSIDLNKPSIESGDNIICNSITDDYGACAYVGYPPEIEGLVCETQDLASVVCHWTKRRNSHVEARYPTAYSLQGKSCSVQSGNECSEKVNVNAGRKIWTLKAENLLGGVVLTDEADLRERVHMAPVEVRISDVNARNVSVMWKWKFPIYNTLNVTCQLRDNTHHTSHVSGVGRHDTTLNNLTPNTSYSVQVRCGTAQHFWKWSEWSSSARFSTKGDVPDALDVWMQRKDNESIIVWKDSRSNGEVLGYEVTLMPVKSPYTPQALPFSPREHRAVLQLDPRAEFLISVTARNKNGSSAPSTLRTPVGTPVEVSSRLRGYNGGFNLSWTGSPLSSCGYVVDWFPPTSENQTIDWLKVDPNVTTAEIISSMCQNCKLMEGVRYLISIYACTAGAPKWLETREGYVKEKRIEDNLLNLKWKQMDEEVRVSWDPVDLGTQSAFIRGYTLYCSNNKNIIRNISTDDPAATRLTVRQLPTASYTFTVKALTAVGECGTSSISATLNSPIDRLMLSVIITLVSVSVLLIFVAVLCFRNWRSIMEKVCPPIPKPSLKGGFAWLADGSPHAAFIDRQSEEQMFEVSLLHLKQDAGIVSTRTQHLKGLSLSTLPPANNVYLAVIPSTMEDLQNLSYNLIVESEDQQVTAAARSQDKSICGFNLQQAIYKAKADPNHLMCCDSAYISAPM